MAGLSPYFLRTATLLLALLLLTSVIGAVLHARTGGRSVAVHYFNARLRAWWLLAAVLGVALALGPVAAVVVFGLSSFMALREFLTLTPTKPSDYWGLFLAFFVALPLQYLLLGLQWWGLFAVFIPVYMLGLISSASALSQDTEDFLARNARIVFALMAAVYGVSHAPALLLLRIPGFEGRNVELLFFFTFTLQASEALQRLCGRLFGRHPLLPRLSLSRTWEGLLGGALGTIALGAALHGVTPFGPWLAALLAAQIVACGVLGGLVMAAVKRSLGARDWGAAGPGRGGTMDRLDAVTFAAPVFFHVVRYFWTP
jgi:phosphatidate cytidylyltransferase